MRAWLNWMSWAVAIIASALLVQAFIESTQYHLKVAQLYSAMVTRSLPLPATVYELLLLAPYMAVGLLAITAYENLDYQLSKFATWREDRRNRVTLKTDRLILRPVVPDDAIHLLPAYSDEENMRYWDAPPITSVSVLAAKFRNFWRQPRSNDFAVALRDTPGIAIGYFSFWRGVPDQAFIGYVFNPDAQGHGFAREAATALIEYAFETRKIGRLAAETDPENERSINLLTSIGFRQEGHIRSARKAPHGMTDYLVFGLLPGDHDGREAKSETAEA